MNRDELRAVQTPLKERYREVPAEAVVTLSATGELGDGVACSVATGRVRAEGDLDFRGTLGVDRDAPVGFSAIRLSFELDADADDEQLATLQRLTERYCVVYQTLASGPALATRLSLA